MIIIINFIFRYIFFVYSLYLLNKQQTDSNIKYVKDSASRCGPIAIKLLQFIIMSAPDLIKTDKLNYVFEDCNIHDIEVTKELYFKDFKRDINQDYTILEVVGSGSLGQVYRAFCKTTNQIVAIKVKHPCINENVNKSVLAIKIVCFILRPINNFHSIFMEYINNIYLQIDYIQEAENTKRLKFNFKNEDVVVIPEIYYYTSNFIIMSYHEAKNFNQVDDKTQNIASMYLNFIYLTSLIVHDFLHADLHYGNWKIIEGKTPYDIKILIYDCGIMCSTGNLSLNIQIIENISKGKPKIIKLLDVFKTVDPTLQKKVDRYRHEIEEYMNPIFYNENIQGSECINKFLRKLVDLRLITNKNLINILSSISIIGEAPTKSIHLFVKYITNPIGTNSLLYHVYVDILNKINKFNELKLFYIDYLNRDPENKTIYENWLYEEFGHKKGYILSDIIYYLFFPKS
jgi:predicted unusual protein kinase regulating ubiquinone biosynthesis (AarF/ABC1/UbiB family)